MVSMNKGDWVGTKAQYIALNSIETNKRYYITDLETFVITNSAMASALTTYSGLYANGDTFLCVDSGTYKQNTFYKLNSGAWVEMGSLVTNAEKSKWDGKPENYQIISKPNSIPTANATSPDFVQVDGITYKKVAKFSSGTVADLTGTRWLFNDTPTAPAEDVAKLINFTSNNESFTAIVLAHYNWATSGMIYGNDTVYNSTNGWTANGYKEIVIIDGRDVTDNTLITWLSANATQVAYEYTQIGDGSNPNLLINGDFYINQRALTTYSTVNKYTVDRWKMATSGTTVTKLTKGITLAGTSSNNYNFYQYIENYSQFEGKTATFSLKFANNTDRIRISLVDNNGSSTSDYITDASGVVTVTRTFGTGLTSLRAVVQLETTGASMSVDLLEAKVEFGSVMTRFIPRPYAEELALCQRYFIRIKGTNNYGVIGSGFIYSTTRAFIVVPLPTTMRTLPTYTGNGTRRLLSAAGYKDYSSFSIDSMSANNLDCIVEGTEFTAGYGCMFQIYNDSTGYVEFDAEIY